MPKTTAVLNEYTIITDSQHMPTQSYSVIITSYTIIAFLHHKETLKNRINKQAKPGSAKIYFPH